MCKLMIVTVGTSLFHSASWKETEDDFKKLLGDSWNKYNEFWAQGEGLKDPDFRRKNDFGIETVLKQKLTKQNAQKSAQWLAPYDARTTPVMRYSAELATILRYADEQKSHNWKKFLKEFCFYFIHDDNPAINTYHAAHHLQVYLRTIAELNENQVHPHGIEGFSSKKKTPLLDALQEYCDFIHGKLNNNPEELILVISGGYKLYSLVGMLFIKNPLVKLIYGHEASPDIVQLYGKDGKPIAQIKNKTKEIQVEEEPPQPV